MIPFDNREGWIWLDGDFVAWNDARLHICTHALHYGSAVFEGERMYNGHIFELEAHTRRLFKSAETLDFEIPFTEAEINAASTEACRRNGLEDCYVRPIAWRGAEQHSVSALHTKNARRDRRLGMAEIFRYGQTPPRHPSHLGKVSPPSGGRRADICKGSRPLYDLHDFEKCRRTRRL